MSATFARFPRDALERSIPDRFVEQVALYPARIAIRAGENSVTYAELGQTVGCIAQTLLAHCGPAAEPVALYFDQGASLVAAALGVLAAGKHYVPLDPSNPRAHSLATLRDLRPRLTLTDHLHRDPADRLVPDCGRILAIDEIDTATVARTPLPAVAPDTLAYVYYTSGSTGRAKGVMDTHRNVLHNIMRYTNSLRITADDRFMLVQRASSSGAVSDVFGALLTGAALFPVDLHHADLAGLATWINREQLTIYHSAPAIFRQVALSTTTLPSLRVIRLEGDTASPRDIDLFRSRCAADSILVNGLGLTECGLVRQYFVTRSTPVDAPVPVGYPVEDMTVTLIDAAGREVPTGEIGELVVESRFLAQGYWGRPDLTAERFSAVLERPGVRRYRTGDLGRLRADGCLEHLGRTDFQPKVRGHRIDSEEIEAALLQHSAVSEAAVMVRADRPDDPRLVAYCVPSESPPPTVSALRGHLTERLPRDLLPASYVWLDRLPLTDSGKVDRRALPAPGRARPPLDTAMTTPRSPVETLLAQFWAEVLGLDEVGVDDDFFDLGGDSLQATHLVGRIRASFGIEFGVPALFARPTVARVAAMIAAAPAGAMGAGEAATGISPRKVPGPFPLSLPQEGLLFQSQLDPGEPVYNAPLAWRLRGALAIDALGDALDAVVARHEPLRTTIWMVDGIASQRVELSHPVDLIHSDLSAFPDASRTAELRRRLRDEVRRPFDLGRDPMLRAHLFRLAANEHVLLLVVHHIATDGWSEGVLMRELSALYETAQRGQPLQLPALPIRYADYVAWQRAHLTGELRTALLDYWRRRLADVPGILDLRHDGAQRRSGTAQGDIETIFLPSTLVEALLRTSREGSATLFMTLLAAFNVVLQRHLGGDDVVVGTAIAGRTQPDTEGLVGLFVNILPLRTDLSGDPTFGELVARVRNTALDAYAHQDLPFASLVAELNPERELGRMPLVPIQFIFEPPLPPFAPASLDSERVEIHAGASVSELTLFVEAVAEGLRATVEYRTALYDAATIVGLLSQWRNVLEAAAGDPQQRISHLPIHTPAERHQLLVKWNATAVDYPRDQCIHQIFEVQAARTPDAVAVVFGEERLTYRELNARANRLAHYLRAQSVGPDVLVGLCLERSLELVVGLLGILKAGGAYVPLDPSYPSHRLAFMLEDTEEPVLLTQERLLGQLPPYAGHTFCVDRDWPTIAAQPATNPPVSAAATNLAYVIYTSGSTGTPKGVMIEHRALVNHMEWMRQAFGFECNDSVLQKTPINFDAAVWEFFAPLIVGGRLVMAPPDAHRDPVEIINALRRYEVTAVQLVPSLFRLLAQEPRLADCARLTKVFCGGEALPGDAAQRFFELSRAHLYNLYGPTETCIDALWWECKRDDERTTAPIGRPIANTRAYVFDAHGEPVPIGVPGELFIGGDGLARGYWNDPELTAERFVADPFAQRPGARMYRTGDRARYLPDGNIEFLGRLDTQVKLRGFRIELGEIEAVLARQPQVREAVVQLREDSPGEPRLVAYVVPQAKTLAIADLRAALKQQLPDYMIPAAFVPLPALPLTPNGKIDRKALPAPDAAAYASRVYEAPVGAIETKLAQIWADTLKLERVGRHDNFFELGGHSLLAVSLLERMRQAGLHAHVRTLFITPTLVELAAAVGTGAGMVAVPPNRIPPGCAAITPEMLPLVQLTSGDIQRIASAVPGGAANIQDIYPLAPLQEGILFHYLMATEGDPYVLSALFGVDSRARLEQYLQALQTVIDRHDILRTAVCWEGLPEPVQVVWRRAPLVVEEVSLAPAEGDVAQQLRARFDRRCYRLDARQAPLMRVFIAHDAANSRWVMLQLSHHLSSDHTTQEVVRQEIGAHLLGQADRLPDPLPFRNFVAQARLGVSREEHEAYFRQILGDVDEPTAPFGLTDVHGDGAGIAEARRQVDASLARRLRKCAGALGVSAASVCHLAWALVLARVSGRDDVVFGTVLFGRAQGGAGADRVLGLFINTLPVRLRVGNGEVQDSVRQTHELLGQLLRHEHAPLVLAQRCSAVAAPTPLFSALLNYRHSAAAAYDHAEALQAGIGIESLGGEERTNYPLTLSVDDLSDDFALNAQVQSPIDPQRVCAFMHTALEQLVGALESAPSTPLRKLDVLPESERYQLLVQWNATAVDYPRDSCIHHLFEEQVARTPGAVAVVFQDCKLSYRELNARANQLAHHLRTLGVGSDVLVGLCLERSLEVVIGLLGILKAGGAYVPLDPSYPKERLTFMLQDTGAPVLLTQQELLGQLPSYAGQTLCLDRDWPTIATHPATNPPATADATNLAYVIYTSGSAGLPKGVMVTHANVARIFSATHAWFKFDERDTWTCFHSFAFDFSVWEIWGALIYGSRLIMVPYPVSRDPEAFRALLQRERVTVLNQTPSAFRQLIAADARIDVVSDLALRLVILGGEALEMQSLRPWFDRHGDAQPQLVNMYGITETTVHVTYRPIRRSDVDASQGSMIGTRIPDLRVHILDRHLQPAPVGVPGELCVSGAGVARGYLNRAELTAERFVADPFTRDTSARLYRSGDVARFTPSGDLEYLGRIDQQVKVRGFRIELGEIEAVLARQPQVREAVVQLREDSPGEPRLVAYVVPQAKTLAIADLRAALKQQLPDYMLPAAFVQLPVLPLTPNGKIDRKALPPPQKDGGDRRSHPMESRDNIERHLIRIWEVLLKREPIGVNDNFFDLGGHSLLAVELMDRIATAFDRHLPLDTLWVRGGTIEALAQVLRDESPSGPEPELVLLKKGSRPPLFVVHTTGGNLFHYYDLARHLDAEQTVYGLQARGVWGAGRPDRTVEAIAGHCIEAMRTVQPNRPYLVAGYSSGGVVAFEMAQQLAAAGHRVALLALLDTYAPKARMTRTWLNEMAAVPSTLNLRQLQELAYFSILHPLKLGGLRQLRTVGEAHRWAHWSYRPRPYAHPIEFFMVKDSADRAGTDNLGWVRWAKDSFHIHRLSGSHGHLVKPPVVEELAARLQACIDGATNN